MGKKVLMVCYYYPPLTDVGCKRSVAFSKYWKKAGWQPHVLSVKNPDANYCTPGEDKPPEGVPVTYARSLFSIYKFLGRLNGLLSRILGFVGIKLQHNYFYDIFCIPDIFIGWVLPAIISGFRIIKKDKIDIIYVSCSPFSAGIIGWWLKKLTGKPLVLDYRDPYGLDISRYQKNYNKTPVLRRRIDRYIAGLLLEKCDLFTVTTKETMALYVEQFPRVKEKIHTIYNGFDHHLLEGIEPVEKFTKFTVVYTGNFYYDIEYEYFFEGLGLLKKEGKINKDNFQFLFYGGKLERIKDALSRHKVTDLVIVKSRIPYNEILHEIKRSHFQLLRIAQPMISTKLFEGLALNVPFLATVPAGEVEGMVKQYSPSSSVVIGHSAESVSAYIANAMNEAEADLKPNNKIELFLETYSRENTSGKLLNLFVSFQFNEDV